MHTYETKLALAKQFHAALSRRDWQAIRKLLALLKQQSSACLRGASAGLASRPAEARLPCSS